jgi:hypothetical protein
MPKAFCPAGAPTLIVQVRTPAVVVHNAELELTSANTVVPPLMLIPADIAPGETNFTVRCAALVDATPLAAVSDSFPITPDPMTADVLLPIDVTAGGTAGPEPPPAQPVSVKATTIATGLLLTHRPPL